MKKMILIDNRERGFVMEMVKKWLDPTTYTIEKLELGDYIVSDYMIERKSLGDLYASLFDGSLYEQLRNIEEFCKQHDAYGILLIEGFKYHEKTIEYRRMINVNEIIAGVLKDFTRIYPIRVRDGYATVMFVKHLHEYSENDSLFYVARRANKARDLENQILYFLQGIPRVGIKRAKKIVDQYGSVMDYFLSVYNGDTNSPTLLKILTGDENL